MLCLSAQAQLLSTFDVVPTSVESNAVTATFTTCTPVYITPGDGIAIWAQVAAPSAGLGSVSNVVWGFDLSPNGALWSGSSGRWPALTITNTLNGTTNTVAYRNFTAVDLANSRYIRLSSIVNGSTNYLTNVLVNFSINSRAQQ